MGNTSRRKASHSSGSGSVGSSVLLHPAITWVRFCLPTSKIEILDFLLAPTFPNPFKIPSMFFFVGVGGVILGPAKLITLLFQNRIGNYSADLIGKTMTW